MKMNSSLDDIVNEKVENALQRIGFINHEEKGIVPARKRAKYDFSDLSGNGEQKIDRDELIGIIQDELHHLKNSRETVVSKWKQLLMPLPFHIVLYILEYNLAQGRDEELLGYFARDPSRKCYLIFRSLYIHSVPKIPQQDERGKEFRKIFIMQHVHHVVIHNKKCLLLLDQWMQSYDKNRIESIKVSCPFSFPILEALNHPEIFSICKTISITEINDHELKLRNMARLRLTLNFTSADISIIEQLPTYTLTSISMYIQSDNQIQFLSTALSYLKNLKQLYLIQTSDMWDKVLVALRNTPPSLRHLSYTHRSQNENIIYVNISPGIFSSTLTRSIIELDLNCKVGDFTGLSEFIHLRSLSVNDLKDSSELQALYSAICSIPDLTELKLYFVSNNYFSNAMLQPLLNFMNGLPSLQDLYVKIYTRSLIMHDRRMAQFFTKVAQSSVKLYWDMFHANGPTSFSLEFQYRTFLTVLFHPKLRYLINNFYQNRFEYTYWPELDHVLESIHDTNRAIKEL